MFGSPPEIVSIYYVCILCMIYCTCVCIIHKVYSTNIKKRLLKSILLDILFNNHNHYIVTVNGYSLCACVCVCVSMTTISQTKHSTSKGLTVWGCWYQSFVEFNKFRTQLYFLDVHNRSITVSHSIMNTCIDTNTLLCTPLNILYYRYTSMYIT